MAVKGTLGKLTIGFTNFRVANDVDVSRKPKFNKEAIATSGDPDFMYETQVQTAEGFVIVCDGAQRKLIEGVAENITPKDCSYTTRAGDNYTATCIVNITDDTTREGKVTVDLMPTTKAGWTTTLV